MTVSDVEELEARLQRAMLAGDVIALDELLSDRLRFVTLDGTNASKEDDLARHRTGTLRLSEMTPTEEHLIEICGEVALVNVAMNVAGHFAGTPFSGFFRYTRVWCPEDGRMRVIAGQVCAIHNLF